jgi:hypothetical protein
MGDVLEKAESTAWLPHDGRNPAYELACRKEQNL